MGAWLLCGEKYNKCMGGSKSAVQAVAYLWFEHVEQTQHSIIDHSMQGNSAPITMWTEAMSDMHEANSVAPVHAVSCAEKRGQRIH